MPWSRCWWQEGRRDQEHDRVWKILSEWDNGALGPEHTEAEAAALGQAELGKIGRQLDESRERRADLVAELYDEDREHLRLRLLQMQSDAAFFAHVLEAPASSAQRVDAERRLNESRAAARRVTAADDSIATALVRGNASRRGCGRQKLPAAARADP